MATSVSDYAEAKIVDHMLGTTTWTKPAQVFISLHTATPGETGASEVAGGSYARLALTWGAASVGGGQAASNATLNFTLMPACTVTAIGVWDASSAGNFIIGGDLTASKTVNSGDTFQLPSGNVTVTMA